MTPMPPKLPVPWVAEMRCALAAHAGPAVGALATVDAQAHPRVRSVVLREISEDGTILFVTDARSPKHAQIIAAPGVELIVWIEEVREQFRIAGQATVVSDPIRRNAVWNLLSNSARTLFLAPPPGEIFDPLANKPQTPALHLPPETLALFAVVPAEAERLELNLTPHQRTRWRQADGWTPQRINP